MKAEISSQGLRQDSWRASYIWTYKNTGIWLDSNTPTQSNNDNYILIQHSHTIICLTASSLAN